MKTIQMAMMDGLQIIQTILIQDFPAVEVMAGPIQMAQAVTAVTADIHRMV